MTQSFRAPTLPCSFLALLIALLPPSTGRAAAPEDNWAQWRGPLATGVAPNAKPPLTWAEDRNIKWKVRLPGRGSSTPIVWDNIVLIQTAIPVGREQPWSPPSAGPYQFVLLCLDRQTGRTLWQKVLKEATPHEGHHQDHGYASYSPATDGKLIISYFGSRGLYCLDMEGNVKWQKDLGQMQTRNAFGEGTSPALYGDRVVINWDHQGADFIAAFDKETGRELWRTPRDEATTWATPLIVPVGEQIQVITAATNRIRSYDLADGKQIWEGPGLTANVIPTPVTADGVVYAISGYSGNALHAIRLGRSGNLEGTDAVLWSHRRATPYVPSPLLYEGRLYFLASNDATLSCLRAADGRPLFESQRLADLRGVYASPVGADGRVYIVGRNGVTAVLKLADTLQVLATNTLTDGIDATPALVGKEMFIRGRQFLYCIAEP
jgi:outer membrane protein assembly factor BamB